MKAVPLKQRFDAKVGPPDENGCRVWTGDKTRWGGLLRLTDRSRVSAHRIAYALAYGSVPDGMFVRHRCRVTLCVTPDHLYLDQHAPLVDRFNAKVGPPDTNGCQLWTGSRNRHGYGQVSVNCRPVLAHRVAYERVNGPVPEGLYVLHRCDVPACVAVEHLYVGTQQDNMNDMWTRGRRKRVNGRAA